MDLATTRRGEFAEMKYLTDSRTTLVFDIPLAEVRGAGRAAAARLACRAAVLAAAPAAVGCHCRAWEAARLKDHR